MIMIMTNALHKNILVFLIVVYCDSIMTTNLMSDFWIAQSIYNKLPYFKEKLKEIRDVFVAAVEEDCIYKCPRGSKPEHNPSHVPQSNGCGTPGSESVPEFMSLKEITECCNIHDICYDTCNNAKDVCDLEFKRCLYGHCDGYASQSYLLQVCKAVAKTLFSTTSTLGCKAYLDSQKNACNCISKSNIKYSKYSLRDGDL